jgi:hypothetical protein
MRLPRSIPRLQTKERTEFAIDFAVVLVATPIPCLRQARVEQGGTRACLKRLETALAERRDRAWP